eukprot:Seg744.1 transcript_id=Seg744.1/GoldUCD/mRNA.D3Y31 product="Multidrug and toxin extrusion protein 1" protein_id=Seg744.1/GoldUCD/D3Y31
MAKCCISSTTCAKIKPRNFKSEAKSIFKLAWPLVFSDFSEYMIPLITLLFIGQYGETPLAAIGLALSFCNITGVALLIGLDTATQTLCSQSYGAGNFQRYGVILQRALILQLIVIFSILPLWINSEKILLAFHQDKEVSRLAGQFIIWRAPAYVLQGIFRTMKSYLVCQQIALPLVVIGFIGIGSCVLFNLILVYFLKYGIVGSGIAVDLSYIVLCILIFGYIFRKKIFKTWPGWSLECLEQWGQFVKLALPGALMIIFDWGTAEVGVFLMGLIGEVELGTQTIVFNILSLMFMLPLGISLAGGIQVGHFLGSGEPEKAINVAKSALLLFWMVGVCSGTILTCFKSYIGRVFTSSKDVIKMISAITPLIAAFHVLDGTQGVTCGLLRGIGLQKYGAVVNFIGFDVIGLPLGVVLGLVLHKGVLGFWCGISVGMVFQVFVLIIILIVSNWKKLSLKARKRALSRTSAKDDTNECAEMDSPVSYPVPFGSTDDVALTTTEESESTATTMQALPVAMDNEVNGGLQIGGHHDNHVFDTTDEDAILIEGEQTEHDDVVDIIFRRPQVKLNQVMVIRTTIAFFIPLSLFVLGIITRCVL